MFLHVDPREAAPDAAHGVKRIGREVGNVLEAPVHQIARLVGIAFRLIHEAQRSEGQRIGLAGAAALDRHHVEAAAAEIGGKAVSFRDAAMTPSAAMRASSSPTARAPRYPRRLRRGARIPRR